jgi:hypothetical protein
MGIPSRIININITRSAGQKVTARGFGTPLFLFEESGSAAISWTTKEFTSYSALASDTDMSKSAYSGVLEALLPLFTQDNAVESVIIAPYTVATDFTDQTTVNTLLNAIYDDNNTFYTVSLLDIDGDLTVAQKIFVAKWVEIKNEHIAFIWDSSADAYDGAGDTDLRSTYIAAGNTGNRLVCVSGDKDSNFVSAILGKNLPFIPATVAFTHRQLNNVVADVFTNSECTNLETKNYSYVTEVGGLTVLEGKGMLASSNDYYIDDAMLIDYLIAKVSEGFFSLLVNNKKIPFTNKGIGLVKSTLDSILSKSIANGQIESFISSVPIISDISEEDRADRKLTNVNFEFTPTGAIHSIVVNGVLSL